LGAPKGEIMAKRTFFAIACAVVSLHAAAWGQGPSNAYQGPYGPQAGPWAGPGAIAATFQPQMQPAGMPGGMPGMMPGGPMQPGPMQAPPMQPAPDGVATADPCCLDCGRVPEWQGFGEFLYMRPGNANVAYGVVFSGPLDTPPAAATPVQVAQPGVANIDFHPGWVVGASKALDECNEIVGTFTHYEGEDTNGISSSTFLIRSMISNPSTWISNAASDWVSAASDYRMQFSLADLDLRWTFSNQCDTRLSLVAGARFASLDQRLDVNFVSTDIQNVHTEVNFDGGGLRLGFNGERRLPCGVVFYGRTTASVVGGTFRGAYTQTSGILGPLVNTGFPADRVVPILDAELGAGISLWDDKLRLTAGYSFSGWYNVVSTGQFIGAVQSNNFTGMHDTLTFDGLVARAEVSF
jgi:hypothetical protein